jgi:hypothetical protein
VQEVEVLGCEDVTEDFEPPFVDADERVFKVRYVDVDRQVKVKHVSYSPRRGYSPNPITARLQRACIEAGKREK